MTTINIRGEFGHLVCIDVHGYENDDAKEFFDANWLRCSVEVAIGSFRGAINASFTTHDFISMSTELEKVLSRIASKASFQTPEETLMLRIERKPAGLMAITGKLKEADYNRSELLFSFESNLSYLNETMSDLREVIESFPERRAVGSIEG